MRFAFVPVTAICLAALAGCDVDVKTTEPPKRAEIDVDVPASGVDVDVNRGPGGLDVDVNRGPGGVDVDVDVKKKPE